MDFDKTSIVDKASGYTTGAIAGGIGGFIIAMMLDGKPIKYIIVGIVAGGFIGYKIAEANDNGKKMIFKNYENKSDTK